MLITRTKGSLVLFVAALLVSAGCAARPPTTPEEIRNANIAIPAPEAPRRDELDIYSANVPAEDDIFTMPQPRPEVFLPLPGALAASEIRGKQARIRTGKGEIVIALLPEEAPLAVSNFIWLARQRFYDGLTWHRVEPGFVIQGGDPRGDGMGGPGYTFPDEPVRRPYIAGTVAMANAGPDTNGSQFFVVLADQPRLPPRYTIFGFVVEGMDVVQRIAVGDAMQSVVIEEQGS